MTLDNNMSNSKKENLNNKTANYKNNTDNFINKNSIDKQIENGRVEDLTVIHQQLKENQDVISTLEKTVGEYESIIKRKQAEFENYKKRTTKERNDFQLLANQKIIEELLPIIDNIEKAIHSSNDQDEASTIRDGIILIEKQLKKLLEVYGVKEIEAVDTEFDPNFHEALQIDESKKNFNVDTVIFQWQKGYLLGNKVIRHAKVVVAKGQYLDGNKTDDDENNKLNIPNSISVEKFNSEITKYIDNPDDHNFIENLYNKVDEEYVLKKDINENDKNKALELFKKLKK